MYLSCVEVARLFEVDRITVWRWAKSIQKHCVIFPAGATEPLTEVRTTENGKLAFLEEEVLRVFETWKKPTKTRRVKTR
jgi:hypothetical protein